MNPWTRGRRANGTQPPTDVLLLYKVYHPTVWKFKVPTPWSSSAFKIYRRETRFLLYSYRNEISWTEGTLRDYCGCLLLRCSTTPSYTRSLFDDVYLSRLKRRVCELIKKKTIVKSVKERRSETKSKVDLTVV